MGIPADEGEWSPRLRMYFKAIQQYHARPKDTHLGELMVTNLSSFPSALTVIPVPGAAESAPEARLRGRTSFVCRGGSDVSTWTGQP